MKTSHVFLLGLASATLLSTAAQSEERWPRWYMGLSGSVSFMNDADFTGTGANSEIDFDSGYGVTGSLGYLPPAESGIFSRTRLELEVGYKNVDFDTIRTGATSTAALGAYNIMSYMANAYIDFDAFHNFHPYIGGGAGLAQVEIDTPASLNPTDDQDSVLAYQGMVGLGYSPQNLLNTEFNVGYRYFATEDPEFRNAVGTYEGEVSSHNMEAGMKVKF